jgi:hypothetical protein
VGRPRFSWGQPPSAVRLAGKVRVGGTVLSDQLSESRQSGGHGFALPLSSFPLNPRPKGAARWSSHPKLRQKIQTAQRSLDLRAD